MSKILKKIMMRLGDGLVSMPLEPELRELDVTGTSGYKLVGYPKNVTVTGSTDLLTAENSVCTLRSFNGKLVARDSTIYIDNALGDLDVEACSVYIVGKFDGEIKGAFCYIKTDDFFASVTGKIKASLGGAYVGSTSKLEADGTIAIKAFDEVNADQAIFSTEKTRIADYRALEGLPHLDIDGGTVVRIGDRFMLFKIKGNRVKEATEVYVNYGNGVALVDARGNILHRKH